MASQAALLATPELGFRPKLSVELVEGQREPLLLEAAGRSWSAKLGASDQNCSAVRRWLQRRGIMASAAAAHPIAQSALPVANLATLVLCVDPRVAQLARQYAQAVGAQMRDVSESADVAAALRELEPGHTLTLVLLSDRLDETLCQAIAEANRARRAAGRPRAHYGFLCGFNLPQLAWLIVKTLAMLSTERRQATFAAWDFSRRSAVALTHDTASGRSQKRPIDSPWTDLGVDALAVRAHGASFDVSLGETVLCGHLEPPLPRASTARAPSCFHDGACFRMTGSADEPSHRLLAVDASPLIWCLDSCASIPFAASAFGVGTSYVFGLIAGAAVGVIGPYLDIPTQGGLDRRVLGLLACGATLGEAASAASSHQPSVGFDRFLLIGSPDLRLLEPAKVEPISQGEERRYPLVGHDRWAWRLSAPDESGGLAFVVADDGAPCWEHARVHWCGDGADRTLIVTLDQPVDVNGWLLLADGGETPEELAGHARRVMCNLDILPLYPFASSVLEDAQACRVLAESLELLTKQSERLRARVDAAVAFGRLQLALDELHRNVAEAFLTQVVERDVSLDRFPGVGFDLEPTRRATIECPTCGAVLYLTTGRWSGDGRIERLWTQCANCGGLGLSREDSPLAISLPTARLAADDNAIDVGLEILNRGPSRVRVLLAGAPRREGAASQWGPSAVSIEAGELAPVTLRACLQGVRPGVLSYRILVLRDAAVEMFALKHVLEPYLGTDRPVGA